ncbi:MAG TPA: ATP-binding protein, partial [Cyanophyceae cyanobacterium]
YSNLPLVECYPGELNQVFMNIITNAIDALEEQFNQIKEQDSSSLTCSPWIQIRTDVIESNWIAIRITNNGKAINEELSSKLFDPFFTTKPVGKGTGLGLSISYQIVVKRHGGRLYCNSKVEQGAEFIIEIPMRQPIHQSALEYTL